MTAARVAVTICVMTGTVMTLSPRPAGQGRGATPVAFDHYHGYEETVTLIRALAAAYPKLARVYSIGKDLKGYDTWLLEISNRDSGKAEEKPAFWADGNIDADEPSATEAILHLADHLLSSHGKDPDVTRLVDATTFYLVPMSNPYMAHLYVSTPMTGIVSSINSRPRDDDGDGRLDEDPPDDVDGDGQILQMRVRNTHGAFRTHPKDPRLMVRVRPDEAGEWTVYSEGLDNDGDGAFNEDWIGGVDLNRNFPFDWQPEWIQEGSGPYPLSEPESRHLVEFIVAHPNIGFVLNGHSGPDDGLLYRPYGSRPDSEIPRQDYLTMGTFAEKFASLSGGLRMLPPYGAEAERRFGPGRQVYGHGFMLEWAYEMAGAFSFVAEHGIIPGDADHNGRVSDEELIRVSDDEFGGKLFVNWKSFTHPTLGAVEIGGFVKFTKPNPPPGKYLERLVEIYGGMYAVLGVDAAAPGAAGGPAPPLATRPLRGQRRRFERRHAPDQRDAEVDRQRLRRPGGCHGGCEPERRDRGRRAPRDAGSPAGQGVSVSSRALVRARGRGCVFQDRQLGGAHARRRDWVARGQRRVAQGGGGANAGYHRRCDAIAIAGSYRRSSCRRSWRRSP